MFGEESAGRVDLDGDECQGVIYNKLAARVKGKVRPDMMYVLEVVDFHWD